MISLAKVMLGPEEEAAVLEVLRSGALREGRRCAAFEEAFAARVGAKFAVTTSSGTTALYLACKALFAPGDEILVPAFSFFASAAAPVLAGLKPVFVDVDAGTMNFDVDRASEAVSPRTKGILPVHLYGNSCDVRAIYELASERGLKVVWDAAQALGTEYAGRDIGAFDDCVCYSFYPTKNITTGEGGMITTTSAEVAARCRLLKTQGQSEKYLHTALGGNYRMTDIAAAIGLVQLTRLDGFLEARRENAAFLDHVIEPLAGVTPVSTTPNSVHSYHQYTVRIRGPELTRDGVAASLRASGVGTGVHYPRTLYGQPALAEWAPAAPLPASERATEEVLSLPVHPYLDAAARDTIASALVKAAQPRS